MFQTSFLDNVDGSPPPTRILIRLIKSQKSNDFARVVKIARTLYSSRPTQPEERPFRGAKSLQVNRREPEPTTLQIVRGPVGLLWNFRLYFRLPRPVAKLLREAGQSIVHVRHPRLQNYISETQTSRYYTCDANGLARCAYNSRPASTFLFVRPPLPLPPPAPTDITALRNAV